MGDYRGRVSINRPAREVFAFLADTANMPRYMPTVRQATPQGGNRLLLEGEAEGKPWRSEGWMEVEPQQRRMRWGAEDPPRYHGEIQVSGEGEHSEVELRLHLNPKPEVAERMQRHDGDVDAGLRHALQRTLEAIRQVLDSGGGHRPAEPSSRLYGRSATMNTDLT
jgi:uncharacterized protein YndB with AHSA1/START domain